MFDVGFAEIFLLVLIGLIVLGPEKLPRVARTLGGLIRRARSSWYSLRRSIEAELAAADVSEPLKDASRNLKEAGRKVGESLQKAAETDVTRNSGAERSSPDQDESRAGKHDG